MGIRGRKSRIEVLELEGVNDEIVEGSLHLKTLTTDEVRILLQKVLLAKQGINTHADIDTFAPLSPKTVNNYIKELKCKSVTGKIQASSRVDPFNDIKNCMAKAAGLTAISELVNEQHFHSDDEVD